MSSTQHLVSSKGSIILKAVESHHRFLSSRMRGIWRRRDCRPDGHWETIALGGNSGKERGGWRWNVQDSHTHCWREGGKVMTVFLVPLNCWPDCPPQMQYDTVLPFKAEKGRWLSLHFFLKTTSRKCNNMIYTLEVIFFFHKCNLKMINM